MNGKESIVASISRLKHPSWSFNPGWRSQRVEAKVAELAGAADQATALQDYLFQERDPVLRQGVRFRLTGDCAWKDHFVWAYEVFDTNAQTGMGSALKSMVVADRLPDEIAAELGTGTGYVFIFERLFWDVRGILGNESLLRAVVAPDFRSPATSIAETRDRFMLRTALEEGWPGLRAFLRGENVNREDGSDALAKKIETIVGKRAHRYLQELDASGISPSEDDLKRFAVLRSLRSREAVTSASDAEERCKEFGRSLAAIINSRADDSPLPAKFLKTVVRYLPDGGQTGAVPEEPASRRRRRAFSGE